MKEIVYNSKTKTFHIGGGFINSQIIISLVFAMKTLLLTLLLAPVLLFTNSSCNKDDVNASYRYEVTGSGDSYNVTYQNYNDNIVQYNNVENNWNYSWQQSGQRSLYISAQSQSSSGSVTVKIIRNGVVLAENSSSGSYVTAEVSGDF